MNQIKIKVDPKDQLQCKALAAYFGILAGAKISEAVEQKEAAPVKKEEAAPKKEETAPKEENPSEKKAETAPVKKEETDTQKKNRIAAEKRAKAAKEKKAAEKKKAEDNKEDEEEASSDISIDDLRKLVAEKAAAGHKTAMKQKLSDLDANNVTTLAVENYEEFYNFVDALD